MPKKIPTLLALFLLFFTIGIISFFVQKLTSGQTKASSSYEPKNLMITNITDTSCKIIWQTETPLTGIITLSSGNNAKITAYDERDITGKMNKYTTHSVSVKNLQPSTSYTISVISGGKQFPINNTPYIFQTGPTLSNEAISGFEPAYGTVKTREGKSASGGIVVLSLENSQTLSTLITTSGSWIIPLNIIRTKDLSRYVSTENIAMETITVYYDAEKTESLTDTANDSPVPDMIIGNSYDFRNQQSKAKTAQTLADVTKTKPSVLGAQTQSPTPIPTSASKIGGVTITSPIANSSLVSTRPMIQGTGIPGKSVTITVGIQKPITGKATVGANRLWSFTPVKPLAIGKQSVTVTTVDEKEKPVALTTLFTILKSGTQVLGDATPSATIEPTATATPEASITAKPMPEPGTWGPTALLLLIGIGLITGGIVLLR